MQTHFRKLVSRLSWFCKEYSAKNISLRNPLSQLCGRSDTCSGNIKEMCQLGRGLSMKKVNASPAKVRQKCEGKKQDASHGHMMYTPCAPGCRRTKTGGGPSTRGQVWRGSQLTLSVICQTQAKAKNPPATAFNRCLCEK